jgi:hypothetical protein
MSSTSQKIVSIHQPNFIPWLGYFYKIQATDVFVILDNVDYQSGNSSSITNRTKIKTNAGELMISVPVKKNEQSRLIMDMEIDNRQPWRAKMLKTIQFNYAKAPFFKTVFPEFEQLLNQQCDKLSDLNSTLIIFICSKLNIKTQIVKASEIGLQDDDKNGRIIEICKKLGATVYLSGNGARKYNDEAQYKSNNIELRYSEYTPPEYSQLHGEFLKGLSILDVALNCGWERTEGFVIKNNILK